jgi:hypothetical protein
MKIEKIEKRVFGPKGKTTKVTFKDTETDRIYGRVVDGFAWPLGEKPGAIVSIAEAADRDHSLMHSPFHCYVLSEFYSQDLESLYRRCLKHRDVLCVERVVGDSSNSIYRLWQECGGTSQRIYIAAPPRLEEIDLNYISQLIRKRTSLQKTLHFGSGSELPRNLTLLRGEDTEKKSLEFFPQVAALGYALSELESPAWGGGGTWTPTRKKTPRNLRYGR